LRIIRPQTLFASLCPVLIGLIVCKKAGMNLQAIISSLTLLCALSLQVLSNLINDLYDYRRGSDKKGRQGFKRALAEGEVTEKQMLTACLSVLALVILTGLYLVWIGGWPILLIGVSAIFFAWLYTATNHSLSYLGIADIFVYLYYGILATMGTIWLQDPTSLAEVWPILCRGYWAGSVCGFCSMCVLMINNLRDLTDDQLVGKRTFPVRFGKRAGELAMCIVILLSPFFAWLAFASPYVCLVILPLFFLLWCVLHAQGAQYNRCLMLAGLCNMLYVLLSLI